MSVWSNVVSSSVPLFGSEGPLVSVAISVGSHSLEALLDALARLDFPINPQIYHEAGPITQVEFPAYEVRLPEIRNLLAVYGFHDSALLATAMLDSIRSVDRAAGPYR